tara:strand:+ start:510 stop:875 length:366 start_codon:yes stop_codon:yes gene_type:complete
LEEIFFFEDGTDRLPRNEMRITRVHLEPYSDSTRINASFTITPFEERPNLSLRITNSSNEILVTAEILEPLTVTTEITLHLPAGVNSNELCTLTTKLYYEDEEPQDTMTTKFYPNGKQINE